MHEFHYTYFMRTPSARRVLTACILATSLVWACTADTVGSGPPSDGVQAGTDPSGAQNETTIPEGSVVDAGETNTDVGDDSGVIEGDDAGDGGMSMNDAGGPMMDASPPPVVCNVRAVDISHVLETGQSNSVSNAGGTILSTTQPYANVMFNTGVMTSAACDGDGCRTYVTPSSFSPLVEGDTFFNFPVETILSGLANQVTFQARAAGGDHVILPSLHGRSGNAYHCLRKGGCDWWAGRGYVLPFDEAMFQVRDGKRLAEAMGKTHVVRAVTAVHGEADHFSNQGSFPLPGTSGGTLADYGDALVEWQRDYETGIKAITGQAESVPLFVSQMSGWTVPTPGSRIPIVQLAAHVKAPGKVIVVGPGYPLTFASDCLHYNNHAQRRLGAYFAKAYVKTVLQCTPFEPLRPVSITRAAEVITVKFLVPVKPLVLDTTRITNPGSYGFTYSDSASSATIASVELAGEDEVRIHLSAAPTGAAPKIAYAQNAKIGDTCPGPTRGPRGNLRDSDATVAIHNDVDGKPYDLFNWSVHFELDVP